MRADLPTGRSGQLLAVLLLLLVVVGVWRLVVHPLVDFYDARQAELDRKTLLVTRLEALADALPGLKGDPALALPPPVLTLSGATDAVAAATLQGAVQDMVTAAGGTLGSVEILPAETVGGLRRIGLRITLSGGLETVVGCLAAIGQAQPPILVDDLQMHGNLLPVPGAMSAGSGKDLRLDASFTVFGYRSALAQGGPT
jgi:hypothetical protein